MVESNEAGISDRILSVRSKNPSDYITLTNAETTPNSEQPKTSKVPNEEEPNQKPSSMINHGQANSSTERTSTQ